MACAWKIGKLLAKRDRKTGQKPREIVKRWKVKHLRKEQGFVGIVEFDDGSYVAATRNRRKPYKTWNGALQFFKGTKYEGKIPMEPTTT